MTQQEREASYARRDEMRVEDHATLRTIRQWMFWVSTSGILALAGFVWFAAQQAQRLATVEAVVASQELRLRTVEAAERTIASTMAGQAQTLRDIRDDQRAMRSLLDEFLRLQGKAQ